MLSIAFMTSGGDSPGMNAAIRALTRYTIHKNATPYAIFNGFKGLLENDMCEFKWDSVSNILYLGGTIIKSSRCPEFIEKENRPKAVFNLIKKGISGLVVIGGDGSLTGATFLFEEWKEHVKKLYKEKLITTEEYETNQSFKILGIAGSIDNDICGTEITLGADTALHRATEAIDCIASTAYSHSRAFVIEIMGRHCGWLALSTFISCEADFVFIPEICIRETWRDELKKAVKTVKFYSSDRNLRKESRI